MTASMKSSKIVSQNTRLPLFLLKLKCFPNRQDSHSLLHTCIRDSSELPFKGTLQTEKLFLTLFALNSYHYFEVLCFAEQSKKMG